MLVLYPIDQKELRYLVRLYGVKPNSSVLNLSLKMVEDEMEKVKAIMFANIYPTLAMNVMKKLQVVKTFLQRRQQLQNKFGFSCETLIEAAIKLNLNESFVVDCSLEAHQAFIDCDYSTMTKLAVVVEEVFPLNFQFDYFFLLAKLDRLNGKVDTSYFNFQKSKSWYFINLLHYNRLRVFYDN